MSYDPESIDDAVDTWHNSPELFNEMELEKYMTDLFEWTPEQYELWATTGRTE